MPFDRKSIVIADDDPLVRSVYGTALEQHEYHVLRAENGAQALGIVEQTDVDIVLLDILMPCKEGLETLIELKSRFPHVTVIAMSGGGTHSKADFLSIATQFGADAVLKKPFAVRALLELVAGTTTEMRQQRG